MSGFFSKKKNYLIALSKFQFFSIILVQFVLIVKDEVVGFTRGIDLNSTLICLIDPGKSI